MPTMAEVRTKYPQYDDLSDDQLAQGLHKKFYSDLPYEEFSAKIGLKSPAPNDYPGKGGVVDSLKNVRDAVAESPALTSFAIGFRDVGQGAAAVPGAIYDAGRLAFNAGYTAGDPGAAGPLPSFDQALNNLGAPQATTPGQQLASSVTRGAVGAMTGAGAAEQVAARATGTTQAVAGQIAARPGLQAVSGASAGASTALEQQNRVVSDALQSAGIPKQWADKIGEVLAGIAGGTAGGIAADQVGNAAGAVTRAGKALVKPFTQSGQQDIAGNILAGQADNPAQASANLQASTELVRGSKPTIGQASQDTGLLAFEKAQRGRDPVAFSNRQMEQNNARQIALDQVAGSEADVAAAEAARSAATKPMREAALGSGGTAPVDTVTSKIDEILASPVGERQVVKRALTEFRDQLDGKTDPSRLYEIRKDIGDAMSGKLGGDKSVYALARKQLIEVRDTLDNAIETAAPGFKAYLARYKGDSQNIDNMKVLQEIQARSVMAVPDLKTGRDVLSQAQFSRNVDNATRKGLLDNLTPEQQQTLRAVGADLDRGAALGATLKTPGSDTFQNLSMGSVMTAARGKAMNLPTALQTVMRPLNWVYKLPDEQINKLLTDAALDPQIAVKLLQRATPATAGSVSAYLRRQAIASTVGATNAAASTAPTQPVPDKRRVAP